MTDPQPPLFGSTRDRRPRRVLMHAFDAAENYDPCAPASYVVRFECPKCGHQTDWMRVGSVTEGRRGIPCVVCNLEKGTD